MKKIGIFYICTAPYVAFWEDFYKTSEENFLPETEKHYFIFTDSSTIKSTKKKHVYQIQNMPWPLITLLRFNYFCSVEKDVQEMDYLMFSNANIIFPAKITEEEFLPAGSQEIFVTQHPGYYKCKSAKCPFDRNPKSTAFVPLCVKSPYVIGAMNGGTKDGFMKMANQLKKDIETDLKANIIARWHDESQLNRYIAKNKNYKLLTPNYCYPVGFELDLPKKIAAVNKQAKFDVADFKGFDYSKKTLSKKIKELILYIPRKIKFVLQYLCSYLQLAKWRNK